MGRFDIVLSLHLLKYPLKSIYTDKLTFSVTKVKKKKKKQALRRVV